MTVNQQLSIVLRIQHNNNNYLFEVPYGANAQEVVDAYNELGKTLNDMIKKANEESQKQASNESSDVTAELVS